MEDEYYAKSLLLNESVLRTKTFLIYFAVFSVVGLVITFLLQQGTVFDDDLFWLGLLSSLCFGAGFGGLLALIAALIQGAIGKARRKPKLLSALADLDRRMDALAKDASAYLA